MTEDATPPKLESSNHEILRVSSWDFRNLDKLVVVIAAVLTFCGSAVLFMPAMGEAIGKVYLELLTAPPPPPAPKPVITPGVVDMMIYTTPAKPAAKAEPKKK